MTEPKKIPGVMRFDDNPLLSNQQAIGHSSDKFILDFKSLTPQYDTNGSPMMTIKHKVITLDPYVAKDFLKMLTINVAKYEEKFGEIKIPDAVVKEREDVKSIKNTTIETGTPPSYMG